MYTPLHDLQAVISAAQSALPDLTATLTLKGLQAPVMIFRDAWGIPHIKAENEHDVFFTQGFVAAQDRLFQMDYDRRRCLGRWAEFAGETAAQADVFMRCRGLGEVARLDYRMASAAARAMLDAYAAGVNAFISTSHCLPIEYALLEAEPELWEPWHSIAVYKTRNAGEGGFASKLWLSSLVAEVGAARAAEVMPRYLPGMPLTVPPGTLYDSASGYTATDFAETISESGFSESPIGESNGWAISGERTTSGLPLVAGDSHRQLDVPNVYAQVHLGCPALSVAGFTIPGFPGVLHFCHNERVAWGMTHGGAETQDVFAERLRRIGGRTEYLVDGKWKAATQTTEEVRVRSGKNRQVQRWATANGNVVFDNGNNQGLSIDDPGAVPSRWLDAAYGAMKARNATEFETSMDLWTDRVNNYPYADVDGNFGYKFAGLVPIRSTAHQFGVVAGWDSKHRRQGYIPRQALPRVRNPEAGWVVTCNQKVVDDDYPYFLSNWWALGDRAQRLITRIADISERKATVTDMTDMHRDTVSLQGQALKEAIAELRLDFADQDTDKIGGLEQMCNLLQAWDGSMERNLAGAAIHAAVRWQLVTAVANNAFGKRLGNRAVSGKDSGGVGHILRYLAPALFNDIRAKRSSVLSGSWNKVMPTAIANAYAELEKRLGTDMNNWRWGRLHTTRQQHPLSAVFPYAAPLLDPPYQETSGDADTPLAGAHLGDFHNLFASVNRYVYDPSDWGASRWIVPLGASGHPASPHYADQQALWANAQTIPQLWDWKTIEQTAESSQRLEPLR